MAKLYFYYAAMNAGKSTTLLQADFNYRERGMETMLWTAAFDDRSGPARSVRALRCLRPPRPIRDDVDLFAAIGDELKKRKLDCVLVDEAQFLTRDHVLQLCRVADDLGIPGALLRPAHRFPGQSVPRLGGSARARRLADRTEGGLRMRPQGDDEPARRREGHAVAAGAQTEIGGNDRYIALCRRHFFERLSEGEARQLSLDIPRR